MEFLIWLNRYFHLLPDHRVTLLPGLFKKRFDINRQYVNSLKISNLLQNHYLEAGLWGPSSKPEDAHWGWESPTCQIRGEFLGIGYPRPRISMPAPATWRSKARPISSCPKWRAARWRTAASGPDPSRRNTWIGWRAARPVWAPHCTVHRNMMGLYDMYAWAGNQQALEILVKWARWFSRWSAQFTREQFDGMLDVETGGMLESWSDLYGVTGEKEHYELIQRYDRRRLFDPLLAGQDVLTHRHANTTIPEAIGAARAWEVTGEERWRQIVEAYWRCAVADRGYYCTGGQTNGEFWNPPFQLSGRLSEKTQEHCTVYHMMRLADYLLRWTGDARFDDYWERNLYNGTLAQQNPDTGMVTYFLPMRSGSIKQWGTPTEDFWCCHGTLIQAHSAYPNHIFFENEENLVLSQYIPCQLDWLRKGVKVSMRLSVDLQPEVNQRPNNRRYHLSIECAQPQEFILLLRMPWWLSGQPEVTVNGENQAIAGDPSTYAQIKRVWHKDTVTITLPQALTTDPLPDRPETVAFMEGPVVLAGILGDGCLHAGPEILDERTLFYDQDDATTILIPDNEREFTRWRIGYRSSGQAQNIRFIPLYEIRDERYAVYFPTIRHSD